jgi:UDP-glucose 4-epimerase
MSASSPLRVLVTGGAGYIGSHVVLALIDAGHVVSVIDNLSTGFRWAVPPMANFHLGDVQNKVLLDQIIREGKIDAIMHFAGSIIVAESIADPLKYYRNNTMNTAELIEAAVAHHVRHFVFSSTAAVYGSPEVSPVAEDAVTRPINPYGMSKLMTEMMLRDVSLAHPFNFCALRYFNVAGADPTGRSGQSTAAATHLIKVAIEAAMGKRRDVTVFGVDYETPDGTGIRDYIHVSDLAAAHVSALNALVEQPNRSHTLNCGYGRGHSVLTVLDAVERIARTKITRRIAARRVGDPAELVADNRRILDTLNWAPDYADLDTIVSHALSWEGKRS